MQNAKCERPIECFAFFILHLAFCIFYLPCGTPVIMGCSARDKETIMSCQKGKPIRKAKPGDFRCKDCGAVAKQKKKLCNPKKVKD
jgi:hypothetical protein